MTNRNDTLISILCAAVGGFGLGLLFGTTWHYHSDPPEMIVKYIEVPSSYVSGIVVHNNVIQDTCFDYTANFIEFQPWVPPPERTGITARTDYLGVFNDCLQGPLQYTIDFKDPTVRSFTVEEFSDEDLDNQPPTP